MDLQPLFDRFLEDPGLLTQDEWAALVEHLKGSPEKAVALRDQLVVAELLGQKLSPERHGFTAQVEQRVCDFEQGEEEIVRQITAMRDLAIQELRQPRGSGHSPWRLMAVAIALLLAVGIAGFLLRPTLSPIATLAELDGAATLLRGGIETPLTAATPLFAGDRLTTGASSRARVQYPDGTWICVFDDTAVRLDGASASSIAHGKQVELEQGRLASGIVPQLANRPMLFVTPTATAKVVGTQIWLAADKQSTQLRVTQGQVEFMQTGNPQAVLIEPGKVGVASLAGLVVKAPLWPVERASLVFAFSSGQEPAVVRDGSTGVLHSARLAARGVATYNARGGMMLAGGSFAPEDDSVHEHVAAGCHKTGQLTIEAILRADGLDERTSGNVLSFGNEGSAAFALQQHADAITWRLKTTTVGQTASLCSLLPRKTAHLVVSYKSGLLAAYLDGVQVFEDLAVSGDLESWEQPHLAFGGPAGGTNAWHGTLEGVAIYNRFFTAADAQRSYAQFQAEHLSSVANDRWQELLPLVDVGRNAVAGEWLRDGDSLRCAALNAARIALPLAPDGDHQLHVEFTRIAGDEPLRLIFPVGQTQAVLVLDEKSSTGETNCGIALIDGQEVGQNGSKVQEQVLENGRRHKVELTVTVSGGTADIGASLDDEPLIHWSGPTRSLSTPSELQLPDRRLPALVSHRGEMRFHAARLKMLTGEARQ